MDTDRILNPAQAAATNSKRTEKMSSNLKTIQNLAASVRDSLASLKPSSGLDDLDTIAKERAVLREKLDLLADAESAERDRLEAEEAAAKEKQRRLLLESVAGKAEAAAGNYQQLTDRAASLVSELVTVLAEREQAFSRQAVGLTGPEASDLLTSDEQRELLDKLDRSTVGIYPGDFANTWAEAVAKACASDTRLRRKLSDLVKDAGQYQDKPLSGARPVLIEAARKLAEHPPKIRTASPVRQETKPGGERYEVDLRSPGPVVDLNAG
ncbi:hypothetical protein EZI54_16405 [Marinobacter halodurans]|uniref:Uncharacterized protein n=1 Tax=Marinobacter halodurans TaxID=2528979 RepID=A0ABY1ZH63_9GAMM|nr:hypothetical protein [Marinobacter halodurans]TBW52220.1 hypothetical protein EZI54_16405 [Marinobacter halodurans]